MKMDHGVETGQKAELLALVATALNRPRLTRIEKVRLLDLQLRLSNDGAWGRLNLFDRNFLNELRVQVERRGAALTLLIALPLITHSIDLGQKLA